MLYYEGKLDGKRTSTYQGKERCQLQFVQDMGNGALRFMEIRVPEEVNHGQFEIGKTYKLPLAYSVVEGEVYWRLNGFGANLPDKPHK